MEGTTKKTLHSNSPTRDTKVTVFTENMSSFPNTNPSKVHCDERLPLQDHSNVWHYTHDCHATHVKLTLAPWAAGPERRDGKLTYDKYTCTHSHSIPAAVRKAQSSSANSFGHFARTGGSFNTFSSRSLNKSYLRLSSVGLHLYKVLPIVLSHI